MTDPRPATRCRRCLVAYADHGAATHEFKRSAARRAGMSVNAQEVEWLHEVLQALMRGKDCRVLAKRPEVGAWLKKASAARKSIDGAKKGKAK